MLIEPRSDAELLERLRQAARKEMTPDEIRRQRLSFVYGNLPNGNTMTRNEVEVTLDRLEGTA